jgi:hypothetical protein
MISPRQIFEDNIRPAELLLKVYRLLEHESPTMEGDIFRKLKNLAEAKDDETLMVISNTVFLGLIREGAEISPANIKRTALCNLLRQAVVTASTAMETYLPALLRTRLPEVINLRGRDFVPKGKEVAEQFKGLTFNLEETIRILNDPAPLFVANKMIRTLDFSYLSGKRGIHATGVAGDRQPVEEDRGPTGAGGRGDEEDLGRYREASERHRASGRPVARRHERRGPGDRVCLDGSGGGHDPSRMHLPQRTGGRAHESLSGRGGVLA